MVSEIPIWEVVRHVERINNEIYVSINVNHKLYETIAQVCGQSKDGLYITIIPQLNIILKHILHTQGVKVVKPDKIGIIADAIQNTRDLHMTVRIIYDLRHDEEISKTVFDQIL